MGKSQKHWSKEKDTEEESAKTKSVANQKSHRISGMSTNWKGIQGNFFRLWNCSVSWEWSYVNLSSSSENTL